jgi:predicted transcriptional regulator/DNA-binding XRE family transcriptional regulator
LNLLGSRLRSLRRRASLSQVKLAAALGISPSYLNLIEHDRRRFPAELMFKAADALGVDVREFATDDRGSLLHELMEALGDPDLEHPEVKGVDAREWVQAQPQLAAAFVDVYRKWKASQEDVRQLSAVAAEGTSVDQGRLPSEEVNDLIARRMNHFDDVETVAELFWRRYELTTPQLFDGLSRVLQKSFRIDVRVAPTRAARGVVRHYDPERRLLTVSESLPTRSRSFQLAHQIGLLALGHVFEEVVKDPVLTTDASRKLGRMVLANYFAGAMLMPYERFWEAAESERYDIEVLGARFRASFEQVCHRLTTLRRKGMEGVPFHLVKVDIAGNVAKRFNGSGLQFARFGGGCPRWAVHGAFMSPGRFRVQVSEMPDGSRWFDVARTVTRRQGAWSEPESVHAIGLGCRLEHAHRLTYADGLDLTKPELVPIGVNCRVCERADCHQRAYPSVKHPLALDENVRRLAFYASASADDERSE